MSFAQSMQGENDDKNRIAPSPDSEDDEPRKADYDSMTVVQLKEALKKKGMTVSGKKADLIARLKE